MPIVKDGGSNPPHAVQSLVTRLFEKTRNSFFSFFYFFHRTIEMMHLTLYSPPFRTKNKIPLVILQTRGILFFILNFTF